MLPTAFCSGCHQCSLAVHEDRKLRGQALSVRPRIRTRASLTLNLLSQILCPLPWGPPSLYSRPEKLHIVGRSSCLGCAGPGWAWLGGRGKARQGTHGAGLWQPTEPQIWLLLAPLLLEREGRGIRDVTHRGFRGSSGPLSHTAHLQHHRGQCQHRELHQHRRQCQRQEPRQHRGLTLQE